MKSDIQIRQYKETSDLDSAIEVYEHLCQFYGRTFNLEESVKFFKVRSRFAQYHILVAYDNSVKRVVGLAFSETVTEETQDTSGNIKLIYVEESHRKQGIMTELIKAMIDYFKEINVDQVRIYLHNKNLPHLSYYSDKLGFAPIMTIVEKKSI